MNNSIDLLLKRYESAVKSKDLKTLLSLHSDQIESYDLIMPFKYTGKAMLSERIQKWFNSYESTIDYSFYEVQIEASSDLAICYALSKTSGVLRGGKTTSMWIRTTLALRIEENGWKIFHEHISEPFDMNSGKAISDPKYRGQTQGDGSLPS